MLYIKENNKKIYSYKEYNIPVIIMDLVNHKTSQTSVGDMDSDYNYINWNPHVEVDKTKVDEFDKIWKFHEFGHFIYISRLYEALGSVSEVEKELNKDADNYPYNKVEVFAFTNQFKELKKAKLTWEEINEVLRKDYEASNGYSKKMENYFKKLWDNA